MDGVRRGGSSGRGQEPLPAQRKVSTASSAFSIGSVSSMASNDSTKTSSLASTLLSTSSSLSKKDQETLKSYLNSKNFQQVIDSEAGGNLRELMSELDAFELELEGKLAELGVMEEARQESPPDSAAWKEAFAEGNKLNREIMGLKGKIERRKVAILGQANALGGSSQMGKGITGQSDAPRTKDPFAAERRKVEDLKEAFNQAEAAFDAKKKELDIDGLAAVRSPEGRAAFKEALNDQEYKTLSSEVEMAQRRWSEANKELDRKDAQEARRR